MPHRQGTAGVYGRALAGQRPVGGLLSVTDPTASVDHRLPSVGRRPPSPQRLVRLSGQPPLCTGNLPLKDRSDNARGSIMNRTTNHCSKTWTRSVSRPGTRGPPSPESRPAAGGGGG